MPGLVFNPGAVMQGPDDPSDRDRAPVFRSRPTADRPLDRLSDPNPPGLGNGLRVVQDDDGAASPLTDQLGEEDRPVSWRPAADVVSQVDQDDGGAVRRDCQADGLGGVGASNVEFVADRPHSIRQFIRN